MRPRILIMAAALLVPLGCAKPEPEATMSPNNHHAHGHHGHGDHGEVNEHGYKGHRFDDPEDWLARFESEERLAWQRPDEVVAAVAPRPDAVIADLGAGTGYFAIRFARAAPSGTVYAVDIEPAMVEFLTQRAKSEALPNLLAIQGEAERPALPEQIDLVFMCDVFHHLADPTAYFRSVAEKLEPGGRVVIVDFRKDNPEDAPGPPAQMRMTAESVVSAMAGAGFELTKPDAGLLEHQYLLEFQLSSG